MARYKAVVEYDGTNYLGFQRQAQSPTVQGELESAIAAIRGGGGGAVAGAGRTDSGVHALGQVIAFELDWPHPADALARALNANLPRAIAVRDVAECAAEFHPRFSAQGRRYRYSIYSAPHRSPLRERFAWHVWPGLDVAAMQAAADSLLGRHDFAAFGTAPETGGHTVRTVREARWQAHTDGSMLDFYVEADAFLYRMVRSIVGTLKQVGAGDMSPVESAAMAAAGSRTGGLTLAPSKGLCLVDVIY